MPENHDEPTRSEPAPPTGLEAYRANTVVPPDQPLQGYALGPTDRASSQGHFGHYPQLGHVQGFGHGYGQQQEAGQQPVDGSPQLGPGHGQPPGYGFAPRTGHSQQGFGQPPGYAHAPQPGYGQAQHGFPPPPGYGQQPGYWHAPQPGYPQQFQNPQFVVAPKSIALTYVLWLLLGGFGIHKFYLGNSSMGITYILLGIFGGLTALIGVGLVLLAILGIMLVVDLFTIPEQVNDYNRKARPQPYFGHY